MCGRFTLTVDPEQLEDIFPWIHASVPFTPRYNIAPTQPVAIVPNTDIPRIDYYRWGLIPSWAKDAEIGNRLINARAETLPEKPSFRTAIRRRRCLILADGFYEWKQAADGKSKVPMYINLVSGQIFAFAGLWDIWTSPDGSEVRSCTIITTQPNSLIEPIHNRMPVILSKDAYLEWLSPKETNPVTYHRLWAPYPANEMQAHEVSKAVNDPRVDIPTLILPS